MKSWFCRFYSRENNLNEAPREYFFSHATVLESWMITLWEIAMNAERRVVIETTHQGGWKGGAKGGIGPPNFWNIENKRVFNKCTIKVCISCCWRCPCISVSSEATYESRLRAREGRRVRSKSPSRFWDRDEGVAGRNEREQYPPGWGVIFNRSGP